MSIQDPVIRRATADIRGTVKTDITETDPLVVTKATYDAAVNALEADTAEALETAIAADSNASAALAAADAAVAAADSFPVSDFLGTITGLADDPGDAATNSGKWWVSAVAGALTNGHAGGAVVADGDRLLSNGAAWLVYAAPPTYLPGGSVVKSKLASAVRTSLTVADATAAEWMQLANASEGVATPTAGDAEGSENTTRICGEAISATGTITAVTWYAAVTGTHEIRIYSKSGSVFTLQDSVAFTVTSTGLQTQIDVALDVQAGWYVGFYSAAGRITQDNGVAGKSLWTYAGDASPSATFTNFASIQLQIGWTLLTATPKLATSVEVPREQLDAPTEATLDSADFLINQLIDTGNLDEGVRSPAYGTVTSTATTRIYGAEATATGTLTDVVLYANNAGYMSIRVYSKVGSVFTLEQTHRVLLTEGVNTITGLTLPITAGEYVGVYTETAGLGQINSGTGDGIWTYSGDADPSATFNEFATVAPQIGWTIARSVIKFPEFSDMLLAPYIEAIQTPSRVRLFVTNTAGRFTEYVVDRETEVGTRKDCWRIVSVYIVDRNQRYDYSRTLFGGASVVDGGAWECAVKVTGSEDFVGTWHGYEELTAAFHIVDGMRVANGSGNRKCREWEIVQRSSVYAYGTATTIAFRTMRLTFTAEGVRCRQQLEWQIACTLDYCYLAMMPIERVIGATQITDTGFVGPECVSQDISASGFPLRISSTGDFIRIWCDGSQIAARMDMTKWATDVHTAWIANSTDYNKLYFNHAPGAEVVAGTIWTAEWTAAIGCSDPVSETEFNPAGHTHAAFGNIDVDSIRLTTGSQFVKLEGTVLEGQPAVTPTLE